MTTTELTWTREPQDYLIRPDRIEITTIPHTDLWQRTYYHFRNDNAPLLQMETDEPYFSFVVRTDFSGSAHRFDQCGIVMYLDSENWLKASVEYENERCQHLGSVVTNDGYSDWATTVIDASVKTMWYRFSRREDDYRIESSPDGTDFHQMRICHMKKGAGKIRFGVYACSPEASSFRAVFTDLQVMECQWQPHDGQQPDQGPTCEERPLMDVIQLIQRRYADLQAMECQRQPHNGQQPDQGPAHEERPLIDIIQRIQRRYDGDIRLRPPFTGEAEPNFPPELLAILRESNGISETMRHPKTFEIIDIGWVLYPYEQILGGTALLAEDHGVEGWNFADDGADCLYLRKADGSISCYDQMDRTETKIAESLEEFYTT